MNSKDLLNLNLPAEVWSLVQRGLKQHGVYDGTFRGQPGPQTLKALDDYLAGASKGSSVRDAFVERVIELAQGEVGVQEEPANSNKGKRVQEYQRATWLDGTGWPWCAAFICWLVKEAIGARKVPFARPETAQAWDFENWARKQKGVTLYKNSSTPAKRGDIVVFTFSHIGLAVDDQKGSTVATIEGNTDGSGSREGGGVYKKSRKRSQIRSLIRFTF